jgi:hypothetical protein
MQVSRAGRPASSDLILKGLRFGKSAPVLAEELGISWRYIDRLKSKG